MTIRPGLYDNVDQRVLELATRADEAVDAGPPPQLHDLLSYARARERIGERESAYSYDRRPRMRWVLAAAALLVIGFALSEIINRIGASGAGFDAEEFVTGQQEMATVRLSDGSVVRLAPRSRLRLMGGEANREVALEGRAFFAIAKQEARPFRVRTRAGDAVVLGTRFQVETGPSDVRVVVVEGRVALSGNGQRVEVADGQMSRITDGITGPVVTVPELKPMTDWVGNFLVFQSTPLKDAAREIEQKYGVKVEIADSALFDRTITMWFSDRTLDEVLAVICSVIDARCFVRDNVATIGS